MAELKRISIRLDENTIEELSNEAQANGKTISEYIRFIVGNRKKKKIEVRNSYDKIELPIETNDLNELLTDARILLIKVNGICNTAIKTNEIYEQDIEKTQKLLRSIVQPINETVNTVMDTRLQVKKEARRLLKQNGLIK